MPLREIHLPCYGIRLRVDPENPGAGSITSDLREPPGAAGFAGGLRHRSQGMAQRRGLAGGLRHASMPDSRSSRTQQNVNTPAHRTASGIRFANPRPRHPA